MGIKSQKDFFAGVMFMAVGGSFAWGASSYQIGDGARMGPGYFPLLLGGLLALVGALVSFKALVVETEDGEKIGAWAWRPLVFILGANVVFGLMLGGLSSIGLPPMGLVIGIFALTFLACHAGDRFVLKEALVLASVLSVFSYVAFIVLLKLQFPAWPTFLTR
jgi:hypothetical protein